MMSATNWGNGTPEGKHYRRMVTDRYGRVSFVLVAVLIGLVVISNIVVSPILLTLMNEKPSKLRKFFLNLPWMRLALWSLATSLTVATVVQSNDFDVIYIAKRLGRITVAVMPPVYLLTMRPSILPRTFYLQLIPIHKFVSRVIVLMSLLHGIFYCYIYWAGDALYKLWKPVNLLGFFALFIFIFMGISSIGKIRRVCFELFYRSHYISAWICLPAIRWHARPRADAYLSMCLALLVLQIVMKIRMSSTSKLRVLWVSPTLLLVDIPKTNFKNPNLWWTWPVASHLRLSRSIKNPANWIRSSHPYTIASLPEDNSVKLVIRPGDFPIKMRRDYTIFGPHNCIPNYVMHQIHSYMIRRCLLIIGGSGIAFGAPVLRYLRLHGADVRMIWVMRDPFDARVLPQLGLHEEVLRGNIEIYYTGESLVQCGSSLEEPFTEDASLTIGMSDDCCSEIDGAMGTIRSATRHPGVASRKVRGDPLLSQYALFMANSRPHLNLRLKSWLYGFPLNAMDCCCADRVIDACAEDKLGAWVMSCGNEQLSRTSEQWSKEAGVCYFQDSFTL